MNQKLSKILVVLIITIFPLLIPQYAICDDEDTEVEQKEISIKDYDFSYWVRVTGYHPGYLVELEDTAELLFSCRKGKTLDQLEGEGFMVSEERIAVLKALNFLKEVKVYKTAFPILNPEETKFLRTISKSIALNMASPLKEDIQGLVRYLKSEGYSKNSYTILFSYVLDNLVWKEFKRIDDFKLHRTSSPEKPIWDGLIYAMYPPRESQCGTNSRETNGVRINYNWSEGGKALISKVSNDSAVSDMFKDLQEYREFRNKKAIKVCKSYKICDSRGNLKIPVIKEDSSNELYGMCKELAEKAAREVLANENDLIMLKERYELDSKNEVIVVIYHEIMWDLLDYLEGEGIIRKPKIFADPENAKPEDVADVMFVIFSKVEKQ